MSVLNKLKDSAERIKKDNKDIPKEADIYQNFGKALELEIGKRIETKTDKGITVLLQPDDVIRLVVGSPPLQIAGKGKVTSYEAVEALLRWNIIK